MTTLRCVPRVLRQPGSQRCVCVCVCVCVRVCVSSTHRGCWRRPALDWDVTKDSAHYQEMLRDLITQVTSHSNADSITAALFCTGFVSVARG